MQLIHGTLDATVPFLEALRLTLNYELNDLEYELHTLHWVGHGVKKDQTIDGKTLDQIGLEFIAKTQELELQDME